MTEWEDSTIPIELRLPRVQLRTGNVGHIVVGPPLELWALRNIPLRRFSLTTACHEGEVDTIFPYIPWAAPSTPTCKNCLKALRFLQ